MRTGNTSIEGCAESVVIGDISHADWAPALRHVDHVVHAAGRVRAVEGDSDSGSFDQTNAIGTYRLAQACAHNKISRLVFLSTVKVNGAETGYHAYSPLDVPQPFDAYGRSKLQAERYVASVCASSSLQFVTIRPPLIYGPGVRANFRRLMRWIDLGLPLPFGSIDNLRSFLSVQNLVDFVSIALRNPAALNRVWMVSDGEDISTAELAARIASAMGRRAWIVHVPEVLLRCAGFLVGRGVEVQQLCGSLRVDTSLTKSMLGWVPPNDVATCLEQTVNWYRSRSR
jgi:UDP-glucose 4-epimerase